MKNWVRDTFLPILLYFLLVVAYFFPVIVSTIIKNTGNMVIVGDDLLGALGYDRIHLINAFKQGIIPWWNPFIHNGLTFHALACGQFFYPFTLLHLIMPVFSAFTVNYMAHVFLAGLGMFLFVRALGLSVISSFISGLIFMFASYLPTYIYSGHFPQINTLIWIPWYLYAFEKAMNNHGKKLFRYLILGCMFIALSLFAGHWQFVLMGIGTMLFYAFFNCMWNWIDGKKLGYCFKPIGIFSVFLTGSVLLAAAQVIPTLIDMNYTIRAAREATYNVVAGYVFRLMDLITFIAPLFDNRIHWEDAGYIGILPLFIAFFALIVNVSNINRRKILFFLFLAIFSLFLSFGNQTPFYAIYYFFKPLRTFRVPARFIVLWMFGLSVLAGYGFNGLSKLADVRLKRKTIVYTLIIGAFFLLFLFSSWVYSPNSNIIQTTVFPVIFIVLSVVTIVAYVLFRKFRKVLMFFILLLIVVDLFLYKNNPLAVGHSHIGHFDMTDRINNETHWLKPIKDIVSKEKDIYPYYRINWSEQPILNMTYVPLTINGYFLYDGPWNCPLTRIYDIQELAVNSGGVHSPIYDLFGVRYVHAKEELDKKEGTKYQKVADNIFLNSNALPRAFMVYNYKVLDNKNRIFQEMKNHNFDPTKIALLEEDIELELYDINLKKISQVNILKYSYNEVVLDVDTGSPGILVLADAYHPGWKVYVDGKEAEIFPVDWAVRGVCVPKGKHIIKFYFFPWYYKAGIGISILTLIGFIVALLKLKR